MAYVMIEQLNSRAQERVAAFVTLPQIIGIVIGLMVIFPLIGLLGISGWAALLTYAAAMSCGWLLATSHEGMLRYEHGVWFVRALLAQYLIKRSIDSAELPGSALQLQVVVRQRGALVQRRAPERRRR